MEMSKRGFDLLIAREALKTRAYLDSVGVWTIGVGHTAMAGPPKPRKGMVISETEARTILAHDIVQYEDAVERAIRVEPKQYEFDAMVSLCFNIGTGAFKNSSVVRRFNNGDINGAANAFLMWNKGTVNGRRVVIKGLKNRRESERLQFLGKL